MFIDTHCHLEKEFYGDINNVIEENRKAGVYKIIVSGCSKEEIVEVLEYAHMYDDVYLTVGFHPEFSETVKDSDINWLKEIIKSNPKVVGIGEIGLDYHYDGFDKEVQKEVFEKQLKLASELNLPVVIHSRDACEDTINILKKYDLKGDIHCFSGSLETAKIYIKMGYYLGIGGVVTFKNSKLRETIKGISGCHLHETTLSLCSNLPILQKLLFISYILIVESKEPLNKYFPSGLKATDLTSSLCS